MQDWCFCLPWLGHKRLHPRPRLRSGRHQRVDAAGIGFCICGTTVSKWLYTTSKTRSRQDKKSACQRAMPPVTPALFKAMRLMAMFRPVRFGDCCGRVHTRLDWRSLACQLARQVWTALHMTIDTCLITSCWSAWMATQPYSSRISECAKSVWRSAVGSLHMSRKSPVEPLRSEVLPNGWHA